MTGQPTPEAIEAVASVIANAEGVTPGTDPWHDSTSERVLAFIRDVIHRDGDDADAIRQALGLRANWIEYEGGAFPSRRRVVSEWQEVEQ